LEIFPDPAPPEGIQIHQDHPTLQVDLALVRMLVDTILRGERREAASLNVILTQGPVVRRLNEEWLSHAFNTDVLSFALNNSDRIDGEVYVSLDYARAHCERFEATFLQEACRYVAHGLLHLIGYADATEPDRAAMRRLEDNYLRAAGILPVHPE